jgi:hypothetical protein
MLELQRLAVAANFECRLVEREQVLLEGVARLREPSPSWLARQHARERGKAGVNPVVLRAVEDRRERDGNGRRRPRIEQSFVSDGARGGGVRQVEVRQHLGRSLALATNRRS